MQEGQFNNTVISIKPEPGWSVEMMGSSSGDAREIQWILRVRDSIDDMLESWWF